MRHAYLVLAHNEPEVLKLLLSRLDDPRNDVYIHFDKKWVSPPVVTLQQAGLFILESRVDVRWADVSMLEAELALFHTVKASGRSYAYHHLISGVDLPLKSQDAIHAFFAEQAGKEFVGMHQAPMTFRADRGLHYKHLFARSFRGQGVAHLVKRILRYLCIEAQVLLGQRRNQDVRFHKGGQWVSITTALLDYLIQHEDEVRAIYTGTFGADEYFIPTLVWNSSFRDHLYDATDESLGAMRQIGWRADGQLVDFSWDDLPELQQSPCLFARKFNSRDKAFLQAVLELSK